MFEETRENPESTTTCASDRPPDGQCSQCRKSMEPYLRPALFGLPPKWFPPALICSACERQDEEREQILREQRALDEAFQNSRISPRFKQRTFENFSPGAGTQKAFEAALSFQPQENWLLFLGPCGVGKTHLAAAIANRFIGTVPTLFITCSEFLLEMREGISGRKKNQHHHLFELVRRVQLLVLDDIGTEKSSEWVQETLFLLLNYRYEHLLPTVFTTNCSLDELEEKLGEKVSSRIIEMSRCIRVDGANWRIKARQQKQQ